MAIIQQAQLRPTKLELLAKWLPLQPWFTEPGTAVVSRVGSYRFDDPAGEVGIETLIVGVGNTIFQVPLTYRDRPLAGAEPWLVGTTLFSDQGGFTTPAPTPSMRQHWRPASCWVSLRPSST